MPFVGALRRAVQIAGGQTATVQNGRRRTWRESVDRSARLAAALRGLGVRSGETVGVLAANSDRFLEVIHACWWIGAVAVPMNGRWVLAEHVQSVDDAALAVLFADDASFATAQAIAARCATVRQVVRMSDGIGFSGDLNLEALIASHSAIPAEPAPADAPAGVFFTGGSTGRSKGVVHSARSLWATALAGAQGMRVPDRPVYLHAAPMFHLGGLTPAFATTALAGTHVFIEAFRPELVSAAIRGHRVSFTALVPVMIAMLADDPAFDPKSLASLKLVQYGGGSMTSHLRDRLAEALPHIRFEQGFGQSEVGGGISTMPHELLTGLDPEAPRRRSAGRVHSGVEIRVTNPDGGDLPAGVVGEFRIRAAGAMIGYLNRPEETAATLVDGWVRTGDAGYLDDDGFIFVCDRIKDVVRPGGENVFSAEVENAVAAHPAVLSVAVIAVPDARWEERVHAVVTLRPGAALTLEQLQEHCRNLIAGYKIPRGLEIVEAMPLSGVGKILKTALREPHWVGRTRMHS
jgi:acyl-CoA synthetase (AMP-forming)/AMP-acid ligase II